MTDSETLVVEYSCRHKDVVSRPLYVDWIGTFEYCVICERARKIVWTERD